MFSIAVAVSALAVGGTYASFTASDSDSGTVTAAAGGDIRLNTLKSVDEVVWNGGGCVADRVAPGDTCEATVTVHNDGAMALHYEVIDLGSACFAVSHDPPVDATGGDADGITPRFLVPGETESIGASVEVIDDNACQGVTSLVGIQVNGSTSPLP